MKNIKNLSEVYPILRNKVYHLELTNRNKFDLTSRLSNSAKKKQT